MVVISVVYIGATEVSIGVALLEKPTDGLVTEAPATETGRVV